MISTNDFYKFKSSVQCIEMGSYCFVFYLEPTHIVKHQNILRPESDAFAYAPSLVEIIGDRRIIVVQLVTGITKACLN